MRAATGFRHTRKKESCRDSCWGYVRDIARTSGLRSASILASHVSRRERCAKLQAFGRPVLTSPASRLVAPSPDPCAFFSQGRSWRRSSVRHSLRRGEPHLHFGSSNFSKPAQIPFSIFLHISPIAPAHFWCHINVTTRLHILAPTALFASTFTLFDTCGGVDPHKPQPSVPATFTSSLVG